MSKIIKELEIKFSNLESKIENKKKFVEDLYSSQHDLLKQRFDEERLSKKHSNYLNNLRQRLLDLISTHLRLEINHLNELVLNGQTSKSKLKKTRSLCLNKSIIRSVDACISRLISKEFKFSCKFSASQLIKYKNILGISEYLSQEENIWDMNRALIKASQNSNLEIFRLFIEADANAKTNNRLQQTCLIVAVICGNLGLVKYQVASGTEINARDNLINHNSTALMHASIQQNFEIVKYLVENGADVNAKNTNKETALILACEEGNLEIVKYLIKNGADLNVKDIWDKTALIIVTLDGRFDLVKYLVENGADANDKDENGWTALMDASSNGHFEMVKFLVANRADVNATDKKGNKTALMLASSKGHFEIVKYLVEQGADVNAKDKKGMTSLIIASKKGHLEVAIYLVENGAEKGLKDKHGNTALDYARFNIHRKMGKALMLK